MLKGSTVIELTDVNSGEKEVHRDDNMITDGLKHALTPKIFGVYNMLACNVGLSSITATDKYDICSRLLGGLFMFASPQKETGSFRIDESNDIVARGTKKEYSGPDTYCGSYNVAESGRQSDGSIKFVWDFATNQGNGTISSLSLTTYKAGHIGYGCKEKCTLAYSGGIDYYTGFTSVSIRGESSPKLIVTEVAEQFSITETGDNGRAVAFCSAERNILGYFDYDSVYYNSQKAEKHFLNTGCLRLFTAKIPISQIGIFNDPDYLYAKAEDVTEVPVPPEFTEGLTANNTIASWYYDNGFLYFVANSKNGYVWNSDSNLKVLKIDVFHNYTAEMISVINKTGEGIELAYISSSSAKDAVNHSWGFSGGGINICNDYIIGTGSKSGKYYRIMLYNNTDVTEIKKEGASYVPKYKGTITRIGRLFFLTNNSYNDAYPEYHIINGELASISPYGTESKNYALVPASTFLVDIGDGLMLKPSYTTYTTLDGNKVYYTQINLYYYPYILFTINNLASPVVKTADKTMKVIYTLREG